jgi:allantoinase
MIVRGGTVVTSRGVARADVAVEAGRITQVGPDLQEQREEVDASGLHVFPGGIDSHVHFNEPGRTEWETIANGSAALAAGGYTSFIDMPLNNLPVTTDGQAFDAKVEAATRSSTVDFGLWGGLVPGNLDRLEELAARGVMGFKAFMCPSGIDEFPACNRHVLREGMQRIASLGSILLVHAEDPEHLHEPRGRTALDFVRSRPPEAELDAIFRAIELSGETGCRLHIVHVSTAEGAVLIQQARERGVDVSGETCPHYLLYVEDDLERLDGLGKCFPPFRTAADREGLWKMLDEGTLQMVVSDHSPSTLALKQGADYSKLWGGISGCQSTRQLLLGRALPLETVAAVTSTNVARRFGLAGKGEVAPGFDADLWLVDVDHDDIVRREDLLYLNQFSAHEGHRISGRTVMTIVRGETVYADGRIITKQKGRLLRPASPGRAPRA